MSIKNPLDLLRENRFLPLFLTQFLGAFNDNLYKNALVILITYQYAASITIGSDVLITLAAGLFILPFLLFSAPAGQLADKYEKSVLIRYTKILEIILALVAIVGFYTNNLSILISVLFLLGLQATFFGPIKYSILPDLLHSDELITGNAFLESGTFFAILIGTIFGGVLASLPHGPLWIACVVLFLAIAGYITSLSVPPVKIAAPNLKINYNILHESWNIIRYTFKNNDLYLSVLGISWFWLIGGTYLAQFPTYVKDILGAEATVVTLFLAIFTAGIGVGSFLCNRILKGKIHATFVPVATLGMTVFAIDLVFASHNHLVPGTPLVTCMQFLERPHNWRILVDLFGLAACGGIYIVPLYAILQHDSDESHRSRAIASNNIINAIFMVGGSIIAAGMLALNFTVTQLFLLIAIANLVVAVYICNLLPEELIKSFSIWLLKFLYRAEIRGLENYHAAGDRVLIIANHTSFLDALLLAALLPDRLTFAIDTHVAKKWWMRILLKLVNTYSLDPTNPLSTKSLIEYLRQNKHVVIFPEGRITVTGSLMKIYEGPGLIADKADASLLPIRIDGAQYTIFSYLKGKVRIRWFPKITLTVLPPQKFDLSEAMTGRERRELISTKLYDLMSDTMFFSSKVYEPVFQSLINAKATHGRKHLIVEDIERQPMSYGRLILASFVLGRYLTKRTKPYEYIGVLLPNSIANVVTFFGLQAYHRVPAMLNFTTGAQHIIAAARMTNLRYVYTSRKFVQLAALQPIVDALTATQIRVIFLEDLRQKISISSKLLGKVVSLFPQLYYRFLHGINNKNEKVFAEKPAVVLFTSGSEGTPKAVVLSHANLQANRFQLSARVDFNPSDRVFNALPMFHSFGLNSATLLPLISGIRVFMYPSPLHYRIVPELCYEANTTIFFGTDTFLNNYAKYAHPYNFYSIRYLFAGAEKLREETRRIWMQKFGVRIMEGYGATEASPVISTNTTMQYKMGTVGRILPGMEYRLEPVDGITDGARLFVKGANIMLGYIFVSAPTVLVPPLNGWHDTGDIVTVDEEGFITIKGRAKRFAKIAGEMVSLAAIEEEINLLWPEHQHAVFSQPDERKGEQIILMTENYIAEISQLITYFKQRNLPDISLPRKIIYMEKIPVMGSGKIDYQTAKELL